MELNLTGKSVIVTGGASNIGRAITLAFAREGAAVTIADLDEAQGRKVAAEAQRLGAKAAMDIRTDITTIAIRMTKRAVHQCLRADIRTALDLISSHIALAMQSEDHREGVRAFLEKRAPRFVGR